MQSVIDFVLAHDVAMAAIVVAVVDFVIELVPSVKSNTLISLVLEGAQKIMGSKPAASKPAA